MTGREIELKFAVDDEAAFDALVRALDLPAREFHATATQVNHFFDTQTFALHDHQLVLRLREEKGRYHLTFKGKEERRTDDGIATERVEVEVQLAPGVAVDVLRGSLSPRKVLADRLGDRHADALRMLDDALGRAELHYVGQFENVRTRLKPVSLELGGRPVELTFELDRTRFAPDRVEHEIEVELTADVDPADAHAAVARLLEDAGVAWRSAPSKAQRFFELARKSG